MALGPQAPYDSIINKINDSIPISELAGPFRRTVIIIITNVGGGSGCGSNSGCRVNRYKAKDKRDGNRKMSMDLSILYSGAGTHIAHKVKSYKRFCGSCPWIIWPYSKYSKYDAVTLHLGGDNCLVEKTIPKESKSNSSVYSCAVRYTEWGTAARRVKCGKLKGTGSSSGVPQQTVTIKW